MSANLDIIISAKDQASQILRGLNQELAGVGAKGQQTATQMGKLDAALVGVTAGIGSMAGGAALGALSRGLDLAIDQMGQSIRAASDLNETMTKTDAVFVTSAGEIQAWSQDAAESFGLSQQKAMEAAATFGDMFQTMGLAEGSAVDMSTSVVELSADLASFHNTAGGAAEVLESIRSGLVGETEPMRRFGVIINETAVQARALEMGLAATKDEISESDKVLARYSLIMEQTATAHGNYADTADDMANQLRTQQAQWEDLQATLGQGLLPVMLELTRVSNEVLGSEGFQEGIRGTADAMIYATEQMSDGLQRWIIIWGSIGSVVETYIESNANAIRALNDLRTSVTSFIDEVPYADDILRKFIGTTEDESAAHQEAATASGFHVDGLVRIAEASINAGVAAETYKERLAEQRVEQALWAVEALRSGVVMDLWVEKNREALTEGHRFNQMVADTGGALSDAVNSYDAATVAAGLLAGKVSDLHAVNDMMNQRIEESAGAISLWEGRVSGVEEALGYLDEQLAAGNITHEEHAEKVGKLTEFQSRLEQGIQDDLIPAFVDEQLAAADLQTALDDLDEKVKNNEISQEDAAAQARDLRAAFEEQTNPVGTLIDKIGELIDTLIDLENQDPEVTITANADAVQAAIESMRDYAANNPINVPINAVVAGGNDAVSYAVGGDGGSAGMGDQAAFREKAFTVGEDAGRNFSKGFVHGASTQYIEDAKGVAGDGVPIGNDTDYFEGGRQDGREYGEGFGDGFEGWLMADWQRIQNEFLSEGGLVGIMTGESQSNLQDDIRAMEAYLAALLQAGFSTDSEVYQTAYSQYQEFLLQLEAMNAIAGTESAQEYWDAYLESLPKEEIGVAYRDIGDDAGREFGRAWVDGVLTEDWWGLGQSIGEDMTEGAVFALDTFDWSGTGYSAGQEFAAGAVTGIAEGFAKNPDTTFGKPPASATDSPPPGMVSTSGAGGSAMFWQGGFNIPMDVYGAGPYDSAFLYEQSQRQNPNRRNRGGGMQPIVINQNIMLDGDVIDRRTEKVMARLAMEAI